MSEVEAHVGTLVPVDFGGDLDGWIQRELGRTELKSYELSWLEALEEERYRRYHYSPSEGILYEVNSQKLDPSSFVQSSRGGDGSVSFIVGYYNGGASFGEVLDGVLAKADQSSLT